MAFHFNVFSIDSMLLFVRLYFVAQYYKQGSRQCYIISRTGNILQSFSLIHIQSQVWIVVLTKVCIIKASYNDDNNNCCCYCDRKYFLCQESARCGVYKYSLLKVQMGQDWAWAKYLFETCCFLTSFVFEPMPVSPFFLSRFFKVHFYFNMKVILN